MSRSPPLDLVFWPLDRARVRLLTALGPLASRLAADRGLRVTIFGAVGVLAALSLALAAPLWLLLLSPLVLGVPHLVADLRYLVVARGLHRRPWLWLFGFAPIGLVAFDAGVLAGLVGAFGALLVARTSPTRRALGLVVTAALFALAVGVGHIADIVFAHVHNAIAVLLWWLLRPPTSRRALVVLFVVVIALSIGIGAFDLALTSASPLATGRFSLDAMAASVAPGIAAPFAGRLVLLFAFAQSVHYLMWLRLVPEDARARATPRTFRASFHALHADLGTWVLSLSVVATLGVAVWAAFDLVAARDGYLRMALFHGHLELVALALVLTEGGSASSIEGPRDARTNRYIIGSGASSTSTASRGVLAPTSVRTGRPRSSRGADV